MLNEGRPSSKAQAVDQSRFNQLNTKSDEQQINLFYFGNVLTSKDASVLEKSEALSHIKKKSDLPIFKLAMESVLSVFH